MMDGHIVYQGSAINSSKYFENIGWTCPMRTNPSDFFMRITSLNYPKELEDESKIFSFTSHYESADSFKDHTEVELQHLQV